MSPPTKIFTWEDEAEKVCALIRNTPTTLRFILKTKDDETLIERWITHYRKIAAKPSDIIIFDNMSTNKRVLEIYKKYRNDVIVVKFSCYFNRVHDFIWFPELYKAIWESSKFYMFIDTDEFLYFYDGEKIIGGNRILSVLEKHQDANFFPTFWLKNAYFRDTIFSFKNSKEHIEYLAAMGKPIIRSAVACKKIRETMIHTLNLPLSIYGKSPCCFILLHLSTLSKEQRIKVNMNKLAQHGYIKNPQDFHTVLNLDINSMQEGSFRYFVREIRKILASDGNYNGEIPPGNIEIIHDGILKFYPEDAKNIFNSYVSERVSFFDIINYKQQFPEIGKSIWEIYDKNSFQRQIPPQEKWEFAE